MFAAVLTRCHENFINKQWGPPLSCDSAMLEQEVRDNMQPARGDPSDGVGHIDSFKPRLLRGPPQAGTLLILVCELEGSTQDH